MSVSLPYGYEFVGERDTGCNLELLFDDVLGYSDYDYDNFHPNAYVDEPDTEDTQRFDIGVIDKEESDRLAAYASATMRDGHATVDMFVVRPLDRYQGIGISLAAKGIELLERVGAKAISFVVEHDSIDPMVPKLVDNYGFEYDEREEEYIRRTEDDETVFVPSDFALVPDEESAAENHKPIDRSQRIAFKKCVSDLLSKAIEHTGLMDVSKGLDFKDGVNSYYLEESIDSSGNLEWIVRVSGDEQVITTSEGIRRVTGQTYSVIETQDEDEPTESGYSERRNDLSNPDAFERDHDEIFTKARFEIIMRQLSRLTISNLDDPIDAYGLIDNR